ncbi:27922_t:CDS:2, partial [Dentiscutata erythropus]
MFINTLVEGKITVKASIDTTSKSNTISKSLFDKLEEDYGLECLSGDELTSEEIKGLDLQFHYKGKWRSLDCTEVIDFQIGKNPSFDLVLGLDWLWMHKAKIGFRFSFEINDFYAKIVIDGMSIPLIEEALDLAPKETTDMFKKLSLRSKDDKQRKKHHRIFHTSSNSDTLDSNLGNSSASSSGIEVIYMKRPILKHKIK